MISDERLRSVLRSPSAALLVGDLVRVILVFLVVGLCLLALVYNTVLLNLMARELYFNDFGKFYYSARYFLEHRDMYATNPATLIPVSTTASQQFLNMNPPHFHLLLIPIAWLSLPQAFIVWAVANVIALAMSLRLIVKELEIRCTAAGTLWMTLGLSWFVGTSANIVTGQLTWLLMWPVTVAWVALRRRQWLKAAVILGICASIKPFLLAVFPYFVLRRQTKAVVVAVLTTAICFAVALPIFGLQAHRAWLAAIGRAGDWTSGGLNASLLSMLARSLATNPFYEPLSRTPSFITPIWVAGCLGIGAMATWCLYRHRHNPDADADVLILLLFAVIVSPLGWVYYLWLPLGPAVALAIRRSRIPGMVKLGVAGLMCPLQITVLGQPNGLLTATLGSIYVWSLAFIYFGVASDVLRRPAQQYATPVAVS